MAYKAKHDSAMLNSILYLSCVLMFVLLPIAGIPKAKAKAGTLQRSRMSAITAPMP